MLDFSKTIILDGAMGTMLQRMKLPMGKLPEELNITHPDEIVAIHRQYVDAGAQILYTNTFGANPYKAHSSAYTVQQLIQAGVENAKRAADGKALTALDIGPIGRLLRPNGDLTFDEAYDMFRTMVRAGAESGADVIAIETVADLLEMKAAILAAKENCDLPIFATMTFEASRRTFAGVSVPAMAAALSGLGVSALGFNCSLGPRDMLPLIKELIEYTNLPVIVKANAGLPNPETNEYDVSAQDFADVMQEITAFGVGIIGGCCGTDPDYIRLLHDRYANLSPAARPDVKRSLLASGTNAVDTGRVCIVGERINPTGKKRFKEVLRDRNIGYILTQAVEQIEAGADILDVNVGLPGTDEKELMTQIIEQLQGVTEAPLQIDSSDPQVIEAALRIYNGKPLVNSVNGEDETLDRILPLVKKYGAAVIGLTLDRSGIPDSAEQRCAIARHITEKTDFYGIPRSDVYIDCLTLTASVQQDQALQTLRAMQMIKQELGVKTVLGVSNISFGLPQRELINRTFLTLALAHGLDLPIINPNIPDMTAAVDAFNVLYNHDKGAAVYIDRHNAVVQKTEQPAGDMTVESAVRAGLKDAVRTAAEELLKTTDPMDVVNNHLIPALDRVGEDFETNKIFLPQLMQAATAAQAGFETVRKALSKNPDAAVSKGKIILATVKGDIHDIGKNIVKVILENYGYDVIDLGKDVAPETIVKETLERGVRLVGLSALMTTTVVNMARTVQALRDAGADCKIMVGGAVLTDDFARQMGADFYTKDAKQSADVAKQVLG